LWNYWIPRSRLTWRYGGDEQSGEGNAFDSSIYTTNIIESIQAQLRKVVKKHGAFPTEDAVRQVLYLALMKAQERWSMPKSSGPPPSITCPWLSQAGCRCYEAAIYTVFGTLPEARPPIRDEPADVPVFPPRPPHTHTQPRRRATDAPTSPRDHHIRIPNPGAGQQMLPHPPETATHAYPTQAPGNRMLPHPPETAIYAYPTQAPGNRMLPLPPKTATHAYPTQAPGNRCSHFRQVRPPSARPARR